MCKAILFPFALRLSLLLPFDDPAGGHHSWVSHRVRCGKFFNSLAVQRQERIRLLKRLREGHGWPFGHPRHLTLVRVAFHLSSPGS